MKDYEGMLVIHGDLFEFDGSRENLISHDIPTNQYNLAELDRGFFCNRGLYDVKEKKMLPSSSFNGTKDELSKFKYFEIPLAIIERGNELSPHVIWDFNRQSLKKQKGFQYVTRELSSRLNGKLPDVKIDGVDYIIDIDKLEIKQKENSNVRFSFSSSSILEPSEHFYDIRTKLPFSITPRISEYPQDVICLVFPCLRELDPIGFSLLIGQHATWLVSTVEWNPQVMNISWKGLDKTNVGELVRRNQIEQEFGLFKNVDSKRKKTGINK